jgi:hypothetical protein
MRRSLGFQRALRFRGLLPCGPWVAVPLLVGGSILAAPFVPVSCLHASGLAAQSTEAATETATEGTKTLATEPVTRRGTEPAVGEGRGADRWADQVVWTAGVLQRVLAERDYPGVLVLAALNRVAGPEMASTPDELEALTVSLAAPPLDRCRALRDPVEGTLCSLEVLTPLVPPAVGRGLAEEGARLVAHYLRPGEDVPPGVGGVPGAPRFGGEGVRLSLLQEFAEEALTEAWRLQDQTLDFASLVERAAGFSPGMGAEEVLARAPGLQALARQHPALASFGGTLGHALEGAARDGDTILLEYQEFLGSITGSARALLGEGVGVGAQARSVTEWATQRSFVYLASRSATLSALDGAVGERIRTVGNAAVDLRREGGAFRANLLDMGQQAAVLALSGNVFAMAAGVASFFELTPGALGGNAAGEIRALRGTVDALREEMEVGFQEMDGRLDEVFEVLDSRFGTLEGLVAANHSEVQGQLRSLQEGLSALAHRMDRMESNLTAYMQAGFDREYSRTLVRCLEHRERHLPPFDRMEFPVFSECLTDFRVRGAQDARDALLVDRTTPVDDLSVAEALSDPSPENLARRLPLLARVADQRFNYPGLQGGRGGANPVEWAVASQAYLTMLQDWPELARSVAPGDLEALLATGLEVQAILQGVVADRATGESGVLLNRVLAYYEDRVVELTDEADRLATRHQQAQLRRADPASLLTHLQAASSARPTLEVPRWVAGSVPQEVRTAAVLALNEPVLVYRTITADSVSHENFRRRFLFFGKRHDRFTFTRTRMEVELRLGGAANGGGAGRASGDVVLARYQVAGRQVLHRVEEVAGGETSENVRSRREPIPDPVGHFLEEIWPTLAEEPGAWSVAPPRPDLLRELEEQIEGELRRYESASLNRVFTSVCQEGSVAVPGAGAPGAGVPGAAPDGPGAELAGEDRDSALRMRQALQGLSSARLLLGAYVRLALPASAQGDAVLRELLYGPDGLLDRRVVCGAVAAGESPLRVVWLEEEPRVRAERLSDALSEALEWEAGGPEVASTVDSTVQQLRAAIRIQHLRARVARAEGTVPRTGGR